MYKAGKFGFMARKIIGVTGTIGTGKSTAAKMLKSMGGKNVLVLDADRIAKKFLKKGSDSAKMVVQFFPDAVDARGDIDSKKLADAVFEKKSRLSMLNALVHPFVARAIRQRLEKFPEHIVILDVPLLVEADMLGIVDFLVVIDADKKSVIKRSKFPEKEISRRLASQLPFGEKMKISGKKLGAARVFAVDNSASRARTKEQLKFVWASIQRFK